MPAGFGEIAERLRRSTVYIQSARRGTGSGIVWDDSGTVITNAHVTRGHGATVELWDGREIRASLETEDPARDLARLKIGIAGLQPAGHGDSDQIRPGALVLAVGNPFGFSGAVTRGVVHAIGPAPGIGRQRWIQAAIRLAPGNSGGPLADAEGRIIGVNTMVYGGMGLAIPVSTVARFVRDGGRTTRLGVTVQSVRHGSATALLIVHVEHGSAAQHASLLQGDILFAAEDRVLQSPDDLAYALEQSGGLLRLQFVRGGSRSVRSVVVRTGEGARAA